MQAAPDPDRETLFCGFVDYLRAQGFRVGVEHLTRVHAVLDRTEGRFGPGDLRTLLCPLFATCKEEQERFYAAYEEYFRFPELPAPGQDDTAAPDPVVARPALNPRGRFGLGSALAGILAFLLALYFFVPPHLVEPEPPAEAPEVEAPRPEPLKVKPAPSPEAELPKSSAATRPRTLPPDSPEQGGSPSTPWVPALPLVLFVAGETYLLTRRRWALRRQEIKRPPLTWPIQVPTGIVRLFHVETTQRVALLLRRRQADTPVELDLEATVARAAENAGRFTPHYRPLRRTPEYLVLVDRSSFQDHLARLYAEMEAELRREGVYAQAYYFEGDPRLCRPVAGGPTLSLTELQQRYPHHRLLLISYGERLLDPLTGELAPWTGIFREWSYRGLLTPASPATWGYREIHLAGLFMVLPASLASLGALAEHWVEGARPLDGARPVQGRSVAGIIPLPDLDALDAPRALAAVRSYLGPELFRWLCACAVYPDLQWDLTLYLATLRTVGSDLLREDYLLRLARLPWFRRGVIPPEIRALLLTELPRDADREVRRALIQLLEASPPPPGSAAEDTHRLHLAVQQWVTRPGRNTRKKLVQALDAAPRGAVLEDRALLSLLDEAQLGPLDFILPRRFRRLLSLNGQPLFGLGSVLRLLGALLATAGLLLFAGVLPSGRALLLPLAGALGVSALLWAAQARLKRITRRAVLHRYQEFCRRGLVGSVLLLSLDVMGRVETSRTSTALEILLMVLTYWVLWVATCLMGNRVLRFIGWAWKKRRPTAWYNVFHLFRDAACFGLTASLFFFLLAVATLAVRTELILLALVLSPVILFVAAKVCARIRLLTPSALFPRSPSIVASTLYLLCLVLSVIGFGLTVSSQKFPLFHGSQAELGTSSIVISGAGLLLLALSIGISKRGRELRPTAASTSTPALPSEETLVLLLGPACAGKTVYLSRVSSLLSRVGQLSHLERLYVDRRGPTLHMAEESLEDQRQWPLVTLDLSELTFSLQNSTADILHLRCLDVPGSLLTGPDDPFQQGSREEAVSRMRSAGAVVFCVDAVELARVREFQELPASQLYLEMTRQCLTAPAGVSSGEAIPLAVIVTKCDAVERQERKALQRKLEPLLDYWRAMAREAGRPSPARVFLTSAVMVGKANSLPGPPEPLRSENCVEPLLWLAAQILRSRIRNEDTSLGLFGPTPLQQAVLELEAAARWF